MVQLFQSLGLDIKILIAQLVNFVVLLAVMYKLGYKPILKFISDRTSTIEQGVKNAEAAKKALEEAKLDAETVIANAHKEAQDIIGTAREQSKIQADTIMGENKEKLRLVAEKAKKDIYAERDRMIQETKDAAVTLVLSATEKVLREKLDAEADKEYVKKVLADS